MSVEGVFLRGPADWWRDAVVYQIYPRSFADSNGDGIGDLQGIISRIDYLEGLGIDAVWLSPFYPSQLADGGYDVDDYRDVDPRLGTLADFDELLLNLHERGIRLFVDIVPNHSSNLHAWFQEALASPKGSPARERYIFRDGRGVAGEIRPSDVVSHFGPTAWTQVADGQWYFHLFTAEQPDFNWDNPEVHAEFLKTLRFWSDRGVDGFRIDVAHALAKRMEPLPTMLEISPEKLADDGSDPLFDRDEVHEIYQEWRQLFNQYDPPRVAVAEAWVHPARRPAYASQSGLGQAFNFDLLIAPWTTDSFKSVIDDNLALSKATGSSSTWVMSNHDVMRHASRLVINGTGPTGFAEENEWFVNRRLSAPLDAELGLARANAATLLILALPGSAYLYQGEELGLPEVVDLPENALQDPQWFRWGGQVKTRDGCRVPIPWTKTGPSFGFGTAGSHLPQPERWGRYSVEAAESDPSSTLNFYRRAIALRRTLLEGEDLQWLESAAGTLAFWRPGGWICQINFTEIPQPMLSGTQLIASQEITAGRLPGNSTVWLRQI